MVSVKELPLHLAPDVLSVQPQTSAGRLSACKRINVIANSNVGQKQRRKLEQTATSRLCLPWHALSSCQLTQGAPELDTPLHTACYRLSLHVFCTQMQV